MQEWRDQFVGSIYAGVERSVCGFNPYSMTDHLFITLSVAWLYSWSMPCQNKHLIWLRYIVHVLTT